MATFVLVPGAWLGSWVWRKITPALEKKGNSVYRVTLTGMGDRVHLEHASIRWSRLKHVHNNLP